MPSLPFQFNRPEIIRIVGEDPSLIRKFEQMMQQTTTVLPDQFEAVTVLASIAGQLASDAREAAQAAQNSADDVSQLRALIDEQVQRFVDIESQLNVLQALSQQEFTMPPDDFSGVEYLADQTSAGSVLTFTFSRTMQQVWVELTSATSTNTARVRTDGVDPTSTTGGIVHAGTVIPFLDPTTEVRVLATAADSVAVYGYFR